MILVDVYYYTVLLGNLIIWEPTQCQYKNRSQTATKYIAPKNNDHIVVQITSQSSSLGTNTVLL